MTEIFLSAAIVFIFAIVGIMLISFLKLSAEGHTVEIIIDGNTSAENLEMLVRAAKTVAESYLIGARIYIQGGSDKEVGIICKNFDIERKE